MECRTARRVSVSSRAWRTCARTRLEGAFRKRLRILLIPASFLAPGADVPSEVALLASDDALLRPFCKSFSA